VAGRRFDKVGFRYMAIIAAALLLSAGAQQARGAGQLGGLRRAVDDARKASEDAKKAAEAKKKAEDDAAKKDSQPADAPAAAPAASPGPAPATASASATTPAADGPAGFQAFSKFDFVPGEKVVALEDFAQDAIGDFPEKWNTNASGEVVTISNQQGRWLKLNRPGFFIPEFITDLPENVTFEFDFMVPPTASPGIPLSTTLVELADVKKPLDWQTAPNSVTFTMHPSASEGTTSITTRQDSTSGPANSQQTGQLGATKNRAVHVAVWRQRQRVRVYLNEEKVWDLPRAVGASTKFNGIVFSFGGGCGNCEYYVANLRVATGAPDTRNKLVTEGKWVTRGILFNVSSDRIRGESYGTLKEVAGVLAENPDLKVRIVGHTDSDGDDAANLDLSKRRAAAVRQALVSEFKIDQARMVTDGLGETQPVDANTTPAGKANNRRVEFIKQ